MQRFRKPSVSRPVFDFFFTVRPLQNLEDTSTPSSMGLDHIVKRESPVLHTGRPSKSNKSCRRGFFTSESISQSLLKAGLRLTCWNADFHTLGSRVSLYFRARSDYLLTSSSHGFRFLSIKTSNPKNSKQLDDLGIPAAWLSIVRLTKQAILCQRNQSK